MIYNKSLLLAETEEQKNSIKVLCAVCHTIFEDRLTFELHHKKSHKDPVVFACVVCDYSSKKFVLLRNHFKRHLAGRFECTECSKIYVQKSELNYHKATVHGLKLCRKCNLEFEDAESFKEHRKTHVTNPSSKKKTTNIADKSCPDCGKILQTTGGLFTHRKMHLESPKFRCLVRLIETDHLELAFSTIFRFRFARKNSSRKWTFWTTKRLTMFKIAITTAHNVKKVFLKSLIYFVTKISTANREIINVKYAKSFTKLNGAWRFTSKFIQTLQIVRLNVRFVRKDFCHRPSWNNMQIFIVISDHIK